MREVFQRLAAAKDFLDDFRVNDGPDDILTNSLDYLAWLRSLYWMVPKRMDTATGRRADLATFDRVNLESMILALEHPIGEVLLGVVLALHGAQEIFLLTYGLGLFIV